jgi:MFS family permease
MAKDVVTEPGLDSPKSGRLLVTLILLGIANHSVLAGSRVVVSLNALSMGASTFTVGVAMSLYAVFPMLLSVATGRISDRIGVRRPMRVGSAAIALGVGVPFAFPGLPALMVSASLVGVGFMAFQIAAQNATGELGSPAQRARNFGLLAVGYSVSGFIGPLIAGFAIDHLGFRASFGTFALIPLVPLAVLASQRFVPPGRRLSVGAVHHGGVVALLRHRTLRRVFAMNAMLSMGWELHAIFIPIYGAQIGFSASEIGLVLSSFAAATFVVRFSMPALSRALTEHQILTGALLIGGLVYLVYPLSKSFAVLLALSFTLGLGLGGGQPIVMSLLHAHAPPGRVGEAAGVRMMLVTGMSVSVPLVLGGVGASLGIAPVFWLVGAVLLASGVAARRDERR